MHLRHESKDLPRVLRSYNAIEKRCVTFTTSISDFRNKPSIFQHVLTFNTLTVAMLLAGTKVNGMLERV